MLLRLTQQDDIATTTWINGTHHGVDPGVFHQESAVPSTKSGHAESTVKASDRVSPLKAAAKVYILEVAPLDWTAWSIP